MQFDGRYMFVGVSVAKEDTTGNARVCVYDTVDKVIVHEVVLPFPEIYSICLIKKNQFSAITSIKNLFAEKNTIIDLIKSEQNSSLLSEQKSLDPHKIEVELIIKSIPEKMKINTDYRLTVRVENHSEMTMQSIAPFPINMAYHWKNIDNTYVIYDGERTSLDTPLFSFARRDIYIQLRTPSVPGEYILEISMVQESQFWFEKYCDNLPKSITVNVKNWVK